MISVRWYWLGLGASLALLSVAYFYFQQTLGLVACPLCMFQRACLVVVAAVCLLGLIFRPQNAFAKILALLSALASATGLGIAGRQVWLQHLPADQVPECGPDLAFMMDAFPLWEVIQTVLQGSGECAEVQWQFLGFSMPEWMVLVFAVYLLISIKLLFTKRKRYFKSDYRRR